MSNEITEYDKKKWAGSCPLFKELIEKGGMDSNGLDPIEAGDVTVEDVGTYFTGDNVEDVLQEVGAELDDLEAEDISIEDTGSYFTGADVEAALQEIGAELETAVEVPAGSDARDMVIGTVQLNGVNPTPVTFTGDTVALQIGDQDETFDLSDNNKTLILTPDAEAQETITFDGGAAGTSESDTTPSEDLSAQADHKFNVSVDGADPVEVSLGALGGLDDGDSIAAAIAAAINGIEGVSGVTCTWNAAASGTYLITSGTIGTSSGIVITRAVDHNVTEELKIGAADGGAETGGTGDFANYTEVTAQEAVDKINADAAEFTAFVYDDTKIGVMSNISGRDSRILMGDGTANGDFGFTNAVDITGGQGLGLSIGMADANYRVSIQQLVTAAAEVISLGVGGKTTAGFKIYAEDGEDTDTSHVDIIVVGELAS